MVARKHEFKAGCSLFLREVLVGGVKADVAQAGEWWKLFLDYKALPELWKGMPAPPKSRVITAARKVPNARKDSYQWVVRMEDGAIYKFRSPQSIDTNKISLAETNALRLLLDTDAWKTSEARPASM